MVKKTQDDHVKNILNPELNSYRAMQISKGIKPKNFAKLNRMKIVQAKRQRKERAEKERKLEEGKQDFFKRWHSKYDHVESRFNSGSQSRSKNKQTEFLRRGSGEKIVQPKQRTEKVRSKPRVPNTGDLISSRPSSGNKDEVDYIKQNRESARHTPRGTRREVSPPKVKPRELKQGAIPAYLTRRKNEWAHQLQRERNVDPDCPSGMVVMKDKDRIAKIHSISIEIERTKNLLTTVPLNIRVSSVKRKKVALESKLKHLESLLKRFMRPKVYVSAAEEE